jgi:hypothetical protein
MRRIIPRHGGQGKRLRSEDFGIPAIIKDDDFEEICGTFKIPSPDRASLKARLDDLVNHLAADLRRKGPDRASDSAQIKEAREHLERAQRALSRLGQSGSIALKRPISIVLGPMLAAQWLAERYGNDPSAPRRTVAKTHPGRDPIRSPMRGTTYFIEEHTLRDRINLIREKPGHVAVATLKEIQSSLEMASRHLKQQPGSRGGPKPLVARRNLLINLVEIWERLGRKHSTYVDSDFVGFCEAVVSAIGWPTDGVGSAIPDAVNYWLNFSK